jgi:hypothetical protein
MRRVAGSFPAGSEACETLRKRFPERKPFLSVRGGMSDFLPHYQKIDPTTWAYVSSLMMVAIFFKFSRFWSVRNFDLVLLIMLAPGLILIQRGFTALLEVSPTDVQTVVAAEGSPPEVRSDPSDRLDPLARGSNPTTAATGGTTIGANELPGPRELPSDVARGRRLVRNGFLWLLAISLIWLIRLLLDPTMVRRPLLDPNLSTGGMLFMGCCLYFFLMANVIIGKPEAIELDLEGSRGAKELLAGRQGDPATAEGRRHPLGYYLVHALPRIATRPFHGDVTQPERADIVTAKVMAILAQLAIVAGMIVVGYWHFDNLRMGIGAATLYLMLPYTAQMTGHLPHALPAALLLWAIVFYRHPHSAGMIIGLGMGTSYFALYLLPLWISFYWQRGLMRFVLGVVASLAILTTLLALTSESFDAFWTHLQAMFGLRSMAMENLRGIWDSRLAGWPPVYRIPVLAVFVVLCGGFAVWPAQKNLGTLLSCSAAVMVAAQFWHPDGGGLYMAWYLPLALLTVFRPNLEDRIALTVLGEGWFPRSRMARLHTPPAKAAA